MPITWTYGGKSGANVKFLLYKGLFLSRTLTTGTPLKADRYNWTIPSTQSTGTTHKIRIVSTTNSSYSDSSNGVARSSSFHLEQGAEPSRSPS